MLGRRGRFHKPLSLTKVLKIKLLKKVLIKVTQKGNAQKVLKEVLKKVNLTQKSAQKSKFNSIKYSKKY